MKNNQPFMYLRVGNESQLLPKEGKRAALYCRTAYGNLNDDPLKLQRESLISYAKDHGLRIMKFYDDVGSGLSITRPGLSQMLADYKAGLFDVVLVYDHGRLSRSLPLYSQLPFKVLSVM